jgi:transporter family-2 protein
MLGLIFSILAGALMSIQGVINTRVTEKIGVNETNVIVQGTGLIVAIIIYLIWGNGNFKNIASVNKFYLLGGFIGACIIFLVIKGIDSLGASYAISAILISQLIVASTIDGFGILGAEQARFGMNKIIGVIAMIIGIVIFKIK